MTLLDARNMHQGALGVQNASQALCAAPALASLCGGGVPSRCSLPKRRDGAARMPLMASASAPGLLAQPAWGTPTACSAILSACIAEKSNKFENVVPIGGKMRSALQRGSNQKRWEVHSSDSEQVQEISEEKTTQTSPESRGPPVLTIIAGLLVIFMVLWVLGSLMSWIVGLIFQ